MIAAIGVASLWGFIFCMLPAGLQPYVTHVVCCGRMLT